MKRFLLFFCCIAITIAIIFTVNFNSVDAAVDDLTDYTAQFFIDTSDPDYAIPWRDLQNLYDDLSTYGITEYTFDCFFYITSAPDIYYKGVKFYFDNDFDFMLSYIDLDDTEFIVYNDLGDYWESAYGVYARFISFTGGSFTDIEQTCFTDISSLFAPPDWEQVIVFGTQRLQNQFFSYESNAVFYDSMFPLLMSKLFGADYKNQIFQYNNLSRLYSNDCFNSDYEQDVYYVSGILSRTITLKSDELNALLLPGFVYNFTNSSYLLSTFTDIRLRLVSDTTSISLEVYVYFNLSGDAVPIKYYSFTNYYSGSAHTLKPYSQLTSEQKNNLGYTFSKLYDNFSTNTNLIFNQCSFIVDNNRLGSISLYENFNTGFIYTSDYNFYDGYIYVPNATIDTLLNTATNIPINYFNNILDFAIFDTTLLSIVATVILFGIVLYVVKKVK